MARDFREEFDPRWTPKDINGRLLYPDVDSLGKVGDSSKRIDEIAHQLYDAIDKLSILSLLNDELLNKLKQYNVTYNKNDFPGIDAAMRCPFCGVLMSDQSGDTITIPIDKLVSKMVDNTEVWMGNMGLAADNWTKKMADLQKGIEFNVEKLIKYMLARVLTSILIYVLEWLVKIIENIPIIGNSLAEPMRIWIAKLKKGLPADVVNYIDEVNRYSMNESNVFKYLNCPNHVQGFDSIFNLITDREALDDTKMYLDSKLTEEQSRDIINTAIKTVPEECIDKLNDEDNKPEQTETVKDLLESIKTKKKEYGEDYNKSQEKFDKFRLENKKKAIKERKKKEKQLGGLPKELSSQTDKIVGKDDGLLKIATDHIVVYTKELINIIWNIFNNPSQFCCLVSSLIALNEITGSGLSYKSKDATDQRKAEVDKKLNNINKEVKETQEKLIKPISTIRSFLVVFRALVAPRGSASFATSFFNGIVDIINDGISDLFASIVVLCENKIIDKVDLALGDENALIKAIADYNARLDTMTKQGLTTTDIEYLQVLRNRDNTQKKLDQVQLINSISAGETINADKMNLNTTSSTFNQVLLISSMVRDGCPPFASFKELIHLWIKEFLKKLESYTLALRLKHSKQKNKQIEEQKKNAKVNLLNTLIKLCDIILAVWDNYSDCFNITKFYPEVVFETPIGNNSNPGGSTPQENNISEALKNSPERRAFLIKVLESMGYDEAFIRNILGQKGECSCDQTIPQATLDALAEIFKS